jgi:platelet-activating factor acetylhydrolase
MAYPSRVVPPPARWQGEAAHVGVADYEPEGSDVFMRLYYPTLSRPPRRGPLWVPSVHYAHGMAHFLVDFTNPKRRWWQKLLARAAYLVGHVSNAVFDTIPATLDAPPRREKPMPLVIFSHGLAGTRNMYAALASALASQGYLVAAVEHRDGSASYTAIHEKHGVTHKPYVHTDGNFAWRREQIGKRVAELDAAVAALSNDAPPRNTFPGSRFDISAFHGLIDASRLVAMGHSFGGATVVAAAGGRPKPNATRIKRAVLLDPWVAPFGPCGADDATHPLRAAAAAKVPTLVVNSHGWGADLTPMYSHATAPWVEAEVEGTKHQDFSDLPLRMPTVAAKIGMKGSVDAARFFDLKLGLIDAFLETADRADADEACASAARAVVAQYADVRVAVKHP